MSFCRLSKLINDTLRKALTWSIMWYKDESIFSKYLSLVIIAQLWPEVDGPVISNNQSNQMHRHQYIYAQTDPFVPPLSISISNRIMGKNSSEWQLIVWGLWSSTRQYAELINLVRAVQLNVTGCFEWDAMSTEEQYVLWSGVKKCWFNEGNNCQSLPGDCSKKEKENRLKECHYGHFPQYTVMIS